MSGLEQLAEITATLELIAATEALVATCLTVRQERTGLSPNSPMATMVFCKVCVRAGLNGDSINHAPRCVVGRAVAAAAAGAAVRPPMPTFSRDEVAALRRMDYAGYKPIAYSTPLSPHKGSVERIFFAPNPVRHIEYEVPEHPWASEEGCAHPAAAHAVTHEDAASERERVFEKSPLSGAK